jgi:riboflavin synthase
MFTGLVEETGGVVAFEPAEGGWRLSVAARVVGEDATLGDSIAVNGCCLTLARLDAGKLGFDILEETRRLTNFSGLQPGARVNLERSLRCGDRLGGHFVTGHIDVTGVVEAFEPRGKDHYLRVRMPGEFDRYIVQKGSIAVDGISLTVAEVAPGGFAVWIIPHTLAFTNLAEKSVGSAVNLEFDLLAKQVEKLLAARAG